MKIRFSLVPYGWSAVAGASVKLQLEGVMLVELATFGGGEDDWADEAVEGGYEADEPRSRKPQEDPEDWSGEEEDEGEAEEDDDF